MSDWQFFLASIRLQFYELLLGLVFTVFVWCCLVARESRKR